MATVLKRPTDRSRGLIVFKHLEKTFLGARHARNALEALKKKYVLAMYFGGFSDAQTDVPFIDFYVSSPGTMNQVSGSKVPRIFLNAFNFIPDYFHPDPAMPKLWDVITVTSDANFKRVDHFLQTMGEVVARRPQTKALVIMRCSDPHARGVYRGFSEDFKRFVAKEHRQQFSTLRLVPDADIFPIPPRDLANFYRMSKVFALFSDEEGAARVVPEALLSGLPVITKKTLKGGTRHFLDATNSFDIDSIKDAPTVVLEAIERAASMPMQMEALRDLFLEERSAKRFESEVRAIFESLGEPFEGELDTVELKKKLPGHALMLPRKYCVAKGDEIRSHTAFLSFLSDLFDAPSSSSDLVAATVADTKISAVSRLKSALPASMKTALKEALSGKGATAPYESSLLPRNTL